MFKAVLGALIGVAIVMMGFYVWYSYMTSLSTGGNHFLFALAIIQVGVGTFILFWASENSDPFHLHKKAEGAGSDGQVDILAQSRKITEGWYKDDGEKSNFTTIAPTQGTEKKKDTNPFHI